MRYVRFLLLGLLALAVLAVLVVAAGLWGRGRASAAHMTAASAGGWHTCALTSAGAYAAPLASGLGR